MEYVSIFRARLASRGVHGCAVVNVLRTPFRNSVTLFSSVNGIRTCLWHVRDDIVSQCVRKTCRRHVPTEALSLCLPLGEVWWGHLDFVVDAGAGFFVAG